MAIGLTVPRARHKELATFPHLRGMAAAPRVGDNRTIHTLAQEQRLHITLEAAWEFFSSPRNLDEITPDELGFKIVSLPGEKM